MTDTIGFSTLQFGWGVLDENPVRGSYTAHLVRRTRRGTPGPTLCGIDRFAKDAPGWDVAGGVTGRGVTHVPCEGCVTAAATYPTLPVGGLGAADVTLRIWQTKAGAEIDRIAEMTEDELRDHCAGILADELADDLKNGIPDA